MNSKQDEQEIYGNISTSLDVEHWESRTLFPDIVVKNVTLPVTQGVGVCHKKS